MEELPIFKEIILLIFNCLFLFFLNFFACLLSHAGIRASQIHGVPRKTLRNWMKRWHIKSVYPMPYQLKKAAEKKRQTIHRANDNQTTATSSTRNDLSPETIETNEY